MASKKQKIRRRWINIIVFLLISTILFINNISDLFAKYNLYVPIQWITWSGLIGVLLYTIFLAMEDEI